MKANEPNEERLPSKVSHNTEIKRSHKKTKSAPVVAPKTSERIKMKSEHGKGNGADHDEPRHPVDLVFSKKKRKERGRVVNKLRTINFTSPPDRNVVRSKAPIQDSDMKMGVKLAGKKVRTVGMSGSGSSPAGMLPTTPSASGQRSIEKVQVQPLSRGPPVNMGSGQWLMTPPVKKMRTDGGKRRPSHV